MKISDLVIPVWLKQLAAFLALAALVGVLIHFHEKAVFDRGDAAGYARATAEWKKREGQITAAADKRMAEATREADGKTTALQARFDELADRRQQEKANHEKDIARRVAAALSGAERLSVRTSGAGCPVSGKADRQGAETGAGIAQEARTDLLPGTAAAIFRIAGEYGQLVRDYNAVVDLYAKAEAACNAQ